MTEARQQDGWNHTAALLAMLANVNRDPKKTRAYKPADFHPMQVAKRTAAPPLKGEIGMLKTVFIDNAAPGNARR
jgi:hypothetical protein